MNTCLFAPEQSQYPIALLIKDDYVDKASLSYYYIKKIPKESVMALGLVYPNGKVTANQAKEYLMELLPILKKYGVQYIYCADATYFKVLSKLPKTDPHYGYLLNCALSGFEGIKLVLGLNYKALIHNPNQYTKLDMSLKALSDAYYNKYVPIGSEVLKQHYVPKTDVAVELCLQQLTQYPVLACDIETYSLDHTQADIATIAFCPELGNAASFPVSITSKQLLKEFFEEYRGTLVFHNASYDLKVIVYTLWMKYPQDYVGMREGINVFRGKFVDTKILAYLNLNTTAQLNLGLKDLTADYLGNYAVDVSDITQVPMDTLLVYNAMDTLGTLYLYEKYKNAITEFPTIYELLTATQTELLAAELVGMPLVPERVLEAENQLNSLSTGFLKQLQTSPLVQRTQALLQERKLAEINSKLKTKQHGMDKVADLEFNPNSNQHLQTLIYEVMELPVLDTTKTGEPATGSHTLEKLKNHTSDESVLSTLAALIGLSKTTKILQAFIPNFKKAKTSPDGMGWLHANFNVTGTVSGRMSCSNPNLQQLPSNSEYGKLIKSCFRAPKGWVFAGADFNALEDRINTLLTKDPNKIKIYTQGFDGHCLRAAYYFNIPVDRDNPDAVNALKHSHPKERQDSKAPTFALTYAGTWSTLVKNCGFSEQEAKQIEANYHTMYAVSTEWTKQKLELCVKQGYIDVAFGLRIRTPLLGRTVLNISRTPREAQAEARSVGNAISGQSYGLLTNRAAVAFMKRVREAGYEDSVYLVSMIHDAIYLLIKDDLDIITWVNNNLIAEMEWQELPEIQHDQVKLGAELDLFPYGWHKSITLPNHQTRDEIYRLCKDFS